MIEFTDFQCPFCKRTWATVNQVLEAFPQEVRLAVCMNPLAFHPQAMNAAKAALAADRQGRFLMYATSLFDESWLEEGTYITLAEDYELDPEQFEADFASEATAKAIARQQKLAAALGVKGVPYFFINGEPLVGARPIEDFVARVEKKLAEARELEKQGVPLAKVHAKTTAGVRSGDYYRFVMLGQEPVVREPKYDATQRVHVPPPRKQVAIPLEGSPRLGDGENVVIVVFSDFQCPFCVRFDPALRGVVSHYDGKASLVFKHFPLPFHDRAMPAALAAMAAHAQGKFWGYSQLLVDNNRDMSDENLLQYAVSAGLDVEKFKADLAAGVGKAQIEADMQLASDVGVRGTPTVFVNGREYDGPRDVEGMVKVIDEQYLIR
jgi:protein-disulfide isomerase